MMAYDNPPFRHVLNQAELVVPDGFPVAFVLRAQGFHRQKRVAGPDFMLELCREAARRKVAVGLFGSTNECLQLLRVKFDKEMPDLHVVYTYSPTEAELAEPSPAIEEAIHSAGVQLLFVGLGCPKQERWMNMNSPRIDTVMVGVGAAFDFHAGLVRRAPKFLQTIGMEWFYRLVREPKRLWRRYLKHNPRFVYHVALQGLRIRRYD
jgi:N-acetylglucosaminyldiphosphoundecaprenol N-acetyl-beta-D-mannosaminyltransferase